MVFIYLLFYSFIYYHVCLHNFMLSLLRRNMFWPCANSKDSDQTSWMPIFGAAQFFLVPHGKHSYKIPIFFNDIQFDTVTQPYIPIMLLTSELWKFSQYKHHNLNLLIVWKVVSKFTCNRRQKVREGITSVSVESRIHTKTNMSPLRFGGHIGFGVDPVCVPLCVA